MYNTYTIGELAKILGITAETIRYYERKNIIQPIKNKESGYRYYTTWDLHMIIRARCYLGFGFSIEEVAELLQKEKLEDIDETLAKQEALIEQNIIYQMNLLRVLRSNRTMINDQKNQKERFSIQTRPGIYRIDTQKCYTLNLTDEEKEELKNFCHCIPFVFSTALFPQRYIEEENKDFYFGIGIEEEYAHLFDVHETKYVHYYPPQTCLYMSFSSRSSQFLTYDVFTPAFDHMKKNNLKLDGDIITHIVSMWKPEEEYFNLHNIWIPIK